MRKNVILICFVVLSVLVISCNEDDSFSEYGNIKILNLTLKRAEVNSAIIEAIVLNSTGYKIGYVLNKYTPCTASNSDSCIYFEFTKSKSDTIISEVKGLDPSTLYYCSIYYMKTEEYEYADTTILFKTKEKIDIIYDTLYDIENNLFLL